MMKVAVYCRVSTEGQEQDGTSQSGRGQEIVDDKATKQHNKTQENVSKMENIQKRFGGLRPEYINMCFAAKLECLTRVLIGLTAVLTILTIVHIILLIRGS